MCDLASAGAVHEGSEAQMPAVTWPIQMAKKLLEDQLCLPSDAGRAILAHGSVEGTICALPAAPGAVLEYLKLLVVKCYS